LTAHTERLVYRPGASTSWTRLGDLVSMIRIQVAAIKGARRTMSEAICNVS
jgi:hypothetical protein